jgi:tetratricopeptide (TPR) repeat protein
MSKKVSIKKLIRTNDVFLSTSDKIWRYVQTHTRKIVAAAAVLLAALLAVIIVRHTHDANVAKALTAFHQAQTLADGNERLEALQSVRSLYRGTPADRQAAYAIFDILLSQKKTGTALELNEELLRTLPQAEEALRPFLLATLAGLFEEQVQFSEAINQTQAAIALVEQTASDEISVSYVAELYSSLGRVAMAAGQTDLARQAYENIILRAPGTARSYTAQVKLAQLRPQEEAASSPNPPGETAAVSSSEDQPAEPGSDSLGASAAELTAEQGNTDNGSDGNAPPDSGEAAATSEGQPAESGADQAGQPAAEAAAPAVSSDQADGQRP